MEVKEVGFDDWKWVGWGDSNRGSVCMNLS